MCGIVGGISKKIKNEKEIEKMLVCLKHRGPDASGIFFDKEKNVFLGHRRLAIIDLSKKANQPMVIYAEPRGRMTQNYADRDAELRGRGRGTTRTNDAEHFSLLYEDLTYKIRGAVFEVRKHLGFGHKENVYQRALEEALLKVGLKFKKEQQISVIYNNKEVGVYRPDFIVEDKIIIELKTLPFIGRKEKKQIWQYLKGSDYKLALLINFGPKDVEIKRIVYDEARTSPRQSAFSPRQSAYAIVYNGEVYNYKEIRKDLERRGYQFRTNSDTEVVLNSYLEWGKKCVEKFRGMFAFAIWDSQEEKLVLFRDRFGVKPLFYYFDGQNFVFASELKAIYQFPEFKKEIDFSALSFYLQLGFIPAPYTIFKNTYKLEPGSILEVKITRNHADKSCGTTQTQTQNYADRDAELCGQRRGTRQTNNAELRGQITQNYAEKGRRLNLKIEKYWQVEQCFMRTNADTIRGLTRTETEKIAEKHLLEDLERILEESFQYRMVADVDVGVFLSGGIDSSLVTAILQKNSSRKIKTFSIGFKEKAYDEAPYARKIAEILGTDHYEYYLSLKDLEEALEKYAEIFDEPFGDSSGLPTYLLAKYAREEVKVALSGDGGDEFFWGYDKYQAITRLLSQPKIFKKITKKALEIFGPEKISQFYLLGTKFLPLPPYSNLREKLAKLTNLLEGENFSELFQLASSYWLKEEIEKLLKQPPLETNLLEFYPNFHLDFREQMQVWDIRNYLAEDILTKTDRTTMAVSLEAREPYLDQYLLEFLAQLPKEIKFKEPKYLLRQILYKYLPKKLFQRPKTGFRPPMYELLKNNLEKYVEEYLDPVKIEKQGIFNPDYIKDLINRYKNGQYINPDKLWLLVAFQMWYQKWVK